MEIIVSHQLTDLDGLGAMVAAGKLYPAAKPVFVGRLHRLVNDFMVLYRDEIIIYDLKEIELSTVQRVIIVDTHRRELLGELKELLDWSKVEVIIYDHHPHEQLDWVDYDFSQAVGSATTILINKIIEQGLKLNPLEATICALAIYADTGNLTHLNTAPDDAWALAYLLKAGANLKIINQFIKEPLNQEQEELLEDLLNVREDLRINGIIISLYSIKAGHYIAGINRVVEQIKALYHLPSLFVLVEMGKRVEIIGRSSDEAVNIGKICHYLGGGGHAGAGAAKVKLVLAEAREKLIELINNQVRPMLRIRKIMSSPVRTVLPTTSIQEVEDLLKKYGHNGVVISQDKKIFGIFSRRDLEKVKGHGLMHAPVKAYMTIDVVTVEADAPVRQARDLMVKYGVGRLPVVEGDELVGIVTRSDILASYYGRETPYQHKNRYGSSLVRIKEEVSDLSVRLEALPAQVIATLRKVGEFAARNKVRSYLVGGQVRDLVLGRGNRDLDIIVDRDLKGMVDLLASELNCDCSYNQQFQTGNFKLAGGYNLDLASTRKERYQLPGGLPEVESSGVLADLFRRDYTVNALILDITPDNWGQLTDFFQGKRDLNEGLLRALHRFSFLDDPTRIIRGIRLMLKLGFSFEQETENLSNEALTMGDFSGLAPSRVIKELKLLFENKLSARLLDLLKVIPVFNLLNLSLDIPDNYYQQAATLEGWLEYFREKNYNIKEWLVRLALLLEDLSWSETDNWNIILTERKVLAFFREHKSIREKLNDKLDPVQLVKILAGLSIEMVILLLVKAEQKQVAENLQDYLDNFMTIELTINGFDLQEMGLKPGPRIKYVLERVFQAKLRGDISSRQEELALAAEMIRAEDGSD